MSAECKISDWALGALSTQFSLLMGNFYTNITVRGVERDSLVAFLSTERVSAYVAPSAESYTVIYDELGDEDLARQIAARFACAVIFFSNHDDDVLQYHLFQSGRLADRYYSRPILRVSPRPEYPFGRRCCNTLRGVRCSKRGGSRETDTARSDTIEADRHFALAKALHLPRIAVGTGYGDIERGEMTDKVSGTLSLVQTPVGDQDRLSQADISVSEEQLDEAAHSLRRRTR